ncbi:hypothetical protein [Nonlabens xiamenensis]|uniref:hypothetical protein n=1 Tax=Nonlabens xiamenensis TaxID=2341043 RepID=UPI000F60E3C4|nr:hypothetical protein [Nonlabens xiamenensis]
MSSSTYVEKNLTRADQRLIRMGMLGFVVIPLIFGLIIYFGFGWVSGEYLFNKGMDFPEFIILGFMSMIVGFCGFMFWEKYKDLSGGLKHVYQGPIQNKRKAVSKSSSGSSRSSAGSRTKTTVTYYIKIKDKEFKVAPERYQNHHVGDLVEITVTPRANMILQFELLKRNESLDEQILGKKPTHTLSQPGVKNASLTNSDYRILRKAWYKKLRKAIWFGGLPLGVMISLISSGWWGLLIFLFPVPIIVIWQLISLLKWYFKYRRELSQHSKKIVHTYVLDKYSSSLNGGSNTFTILTKEGEFEVDQAFYQKIQGSEQIVVEKSAILEIVLATRLTLA